MTIPNVRNEKFPNRRCTCGYRGFSTRPATDRKNVSRYVLIGSDPDVWGLFESELRSCNTTLSCSSCARVRNRRTQSDIAVFGFYVDSGKLYVVSSDVQDTSCFQVTVTGPQGQYNLSLTESVDDMLPLDLEEPDETFGSPPGPAADSLLEANLPTITVGGQYSVYINNTCCNTSVLLGYVDLVTSGDGYGAVAYGTKQGG